MSIISDNLLSDKLQAVKQAELELQAEKDRIYIVLGEWLEQALSDNKNQDLITLFVRECENKNYLSKKTQRTTAKRVADKLATTAKTTDSKHADTVAKNQAVTGSNNAQNNAHKPQ